MPENWKPCKTTDTEEIYIFQFCYRGYTWDHPCDEYYRTLYEEEKKKGNKHQTEEKKAQQEREKKEVRKMLGKDKKEKRKGTAPSLQILLRPGIKVLGLHLIVSPSWIEECPRQATSRELQTSRKNWWQCSRFE